MNKIINLLSRKISKEYSVSKKDHSDLSDPTDIIIASYRCAKDLFDITSNNSIATYTLAFYMGHIDEALDAYTRNMNGFNAASSFLINVQKLLNGGSQALQQNLSSELINNSDYYRLFTLDYYLELKRTKGLNATLAELEDDVNIRASTYFNSAYKEYLSLLPGFEEIIRKYTDLK